MTTCVFVYGTLKSGEGNHRLVEELVEAVEPGTVSGFRLWDCGGFPGATPDESRRVRGEMLILDEPSIAIAILDRLEGHPHFYRRRRVTVELDSGETRDAWMYVLSKPPCLDLWVPMQVDEWNKRRGT